MFRSLLIAIDLSPRSDRVVGRAAALPLAEGSRLTLLHVVPSSLEPRARQRAERDAKKALEEEAEGLARKLPKKATVRTLVRVGPVATEVGKSASAAKAEMIVMGRGGGRAVRDTFLGSTAERVARLGRLPVLVVRLPPRAPYGRPALALDLDDAAREVVPVLLRVVPPPRPHVAVIHAYDAPYQGPIYPSLSEDDAEEYRVEHHRKALLGLDKILTAALARASVPAGDAPSWRMDVRYGTPRIVIAKAVKKIEPDLLGLGTRGRSGLAQAFLGTVAGDVLREVTCDVLMVPPRRGASRAS